MEELECFWMMQKAMKQCKKSQQESDTFDSQNNSWANFSNYRQFIPENKLVKFMNYFGFTDEPSKPVHICGV